MHARGLACAAVLFGLILASLGAGAPPALAGADVCPEPNDSFATACFLGPGSPAEGFLDRPSDVDTYRLDVPAGALVSATLGALPADYVLRLHLPDGGVAAESVQPGRGNKVVHADGLPPGTYYLAISSPRGEANPDVPYVLGVSYQPAIVLSSPAAPLAPLGAPRGSWAYVPAPARAYGLRVTDVGPAYREIGREEAEGGRSFSTRIAAANARPVRSFWVSPDAIGTIDTEVLIFPYGSNDELAAAFDQRLDRWQRQGLNVQPAVGWGSEQVYSYSAPPQLGLMFRGIIFRHRNAVASMEMIGLEQYATWDNLSRLMAVVESRILAALL